MEKTGKNRIVLSNRLRDPFHFEDIINMQENILMSTGELDMSRVSFIEPYSMLSLLLLGRNYIRSRGEKLRLINIPLQIHQYLARMDFFKTGIFEQSAPLDEKYFLKRSSFSTRVIEVTEIPNKERESVKVIASVIKLFRKRASHILKFWINDSSVDFFVTVISELCQNIFEHSLDSGFLSLQTYSLERENIFRLVISDSGIGIKKSFDEGRQIDYESPAKLIEMALTTPISSKRDFGYGLCQVNTIVEKLKGLIYIRSENASVTAVYSNRSGRQPYLFLKNELTYFHGTQISISLSGAR